MSYSYGSCVSYSYRCVSYWCISWSCYSDSHQTHEGNDLLWKIQKYIIFIIL
jgi:hypothetical protein